MEAELDYVEAYFRALSQEIQEGAPATAKYGFLYLAAEQAVKAVVHLRYMLNDGQEKQRFGEEICKKPWIQGGAGNRHSPIPNPF